MSLRRRLARLTAQIGPAADDPRLAWTAWQGTPSNRRVVLAIVDCCALYAGTFPAIGGPANAPTFTALPHEGRALLLRLYALWGASRRFPTFIASLVNEEAQVVSPMWAITALAERAEIRRRFRGLLKQFADRGDPTYTSHCTYRAENWPDRDQWTTAERTYLSKRFFDWDNGPRRRESRTLPAHLTPKPSPGASVRFPLPR